MMHSVANGSPLYKRVVSQQELILHTELEYAACAYGLVPNDVPGPALHRLEADGMILVVIHPVAPHTDVGEAIIRLQSVVGDVEDVVSVYVAVAFRVGDSIGDAGNAVICDYVT